MTKNFAQNDSTDSLGRNRENTEDRLLKAAMKVFSKRGYHGASVAEIARSARANVSLINRYFGGKEGLFLALVEGVIVEKQSGKLTYPPYPALADEVLAYLKFRYREDKKLRDFMRLCVGEIATNDELRGKALSSLRYGQDDNFQERLIDLQHSGTIKQDADLEKLFRMISLISFSASFVERELVGMPERATESVFETFSTMIEREFGSSAA
ncbi:hypothetical protein GCM10009096_02150 [Parasphingorhabdus litoris]|uniref:HTH tetR-type domain-containing protein n=1 Tax=Parasphingorhabdus litoris TaxID=394733 RepID=A0ABP3JVA3_9SPHN|nr:TetR/AcrR family transcriptional regulator [Parasphingorhabdus litoris]